MPESLASAKRGCIRFVKMQGVGNDFVVVGEEALAVTTPEHLAIALCERQFGIGADGLLIIGAPTDARAAYSFAMRNPDGTPDMCGNGMRCAALYAYHNGNVKETGKDFLVDTQDGLLTCRILHVGSHSLTAQVRVQMAVPRLMAQDIPFTGAQRDRPVVNHQLTVLNNSLEVTAVNTGSTHTIAFRDELPGDGEFFSVSPLVEYSSEFPERTSLIWTRQTGAGSLQVRIWERGAGETLGCGTGACAAGVAAILTGRARHGDVIEVQSRGGTVQIEWPSIDDAVILTGPSVWVFAGETTDNVRH